MLDVVPALHNTLSSILPVKVAHNKKLVQLPISYMMHRRLSKIKSIDLAMRWTFLPVKL